MNVIEARVVLRERSLLDVLDLALRFLVTRVRAYATVGAFVLLPGFAVSWLVARAGGWGVGWFFAIALSFCAQVPFTLLASRLVFESDARAGQVLADGLRALPRTVAMRILQTLGVWLGTAVLFVPGIWFAVTSVFVPEVCLLERASPFKSFGRASRLAAGNSSEAFLTALSLLASHVTATLLGDVGGRALFGELMQLPTPPSIFDVGGSVFGLAGFWLAIPFIATARFLVYLNLRTRAEGWDIQTRFAAIAARSDAEEIRA